MSLVAECTEHLYETKRRSGGRRQGALSLGWNTTVQGIEFGDSRQQGFAGAGMEYTGGGGTLSTSARPQSFH